MKNKKIKLLFALLPTLCLLSCGEDISEKEYKLDIYDYFEQVVEMPEKEYYKANEVVEITLKKHDDARCGGIVNNEIDLELFDSNELGNIYTFTMPSKDSILKVTYDGYFYDACEIGEHQFDDGRKASEYSNMLVYTCQVCGYQTKDYKEVTNSYKFDIVLEKSDIYDTSYSYVEGDDFQLEYGYRYSLKIYFSLADFKENIDEQIFIDTSSNLIVDFSHCSTYSKYAHYYLYVKDIGESYINIICPKGTYKFNLNINEFDLESSGYKTPTTKEEALECKEFRDIVENISYYNFDSELYEGFDNRWSDNMDLPIYTNNDYGEYVYNLDYLKYLPDSVYYPSHFSMINENPISSRSFSIYVGDRDEYFKEDGQKAFPYYDVSYSVIDPGCTHPVNPISYMSFECYNKDYLSSNNSLDNLYYGPISILNKYKEYFYLFNLDNLDVYIILKSNYYFAVFEDDNYYYKISVSIS